MPRFGKTILLLVGASFFQCAGGLAQDGGGANDDAKAPRGIARTIREIQNRHGGILGVKLAELAQQLQLSNPAIFEYFNDNKSRRGAVIYAAAGGGAGDKTVRLVFYAGKGAEHTGGAEFSKIKGWVFVRLAADGFAQSAAKTLVAAGGEEFNVSVNSNDSIAEVIVHPVGSNIQYEPVAGESVVYR